MSTQAWEQPLISVDVITVKLDKSDGRLKVFLGLRKNEPYKGEYALPGVLLSPHERVLEAAERAVTSKALVPVEQIRIIRDIGISDNPDRDPRGATLSVVNVAIIDNAFQVDDSDDVKLVAVSDIAALELPFDHENLVLKVLSQLGSLLMNDHDVSKALLGDEFKTTELYDAYSELNLLLPDAVAVPDLSNLSRRLKSTRGITSKTVESKSSTGRGRPSSVWVWE